MTADERAARVAKRQRGRITAVQLREAGLSEREIRVRRRNGILVAEHRGVYAFASAPPVPFAREHAALLACGEDAKLSHRSAGAVRRLIPLTAAVDVTLPPGRKRERQGVTVHQREVADHEWVTFDGLRITTPARTLHDLAELLTVPALRRAINEADVQGLVEPGDLTARGGARGARAMRRALGERLITKSNLERRFLKLVEQAGLPAPDETNADLAGFNVDAVWHDARIVVELDSHATHAGPANFHRDRRKDLALRAAGYDPRRYSDHMVATAPLQVVADLTRALHFLK